VASGDTLEEINRLMQEGIGVSPGRHAPGRGGNSHKKMQDEHIIPSGPLKGRRIEWPSRDGVENLQEIATEFMLKVFALEPSEYLITDESHLSDFREITEDDIREAPRRRAAKEPAPRAKPWDPEAFRAKIREHYGEEIAAFESGNLLGIFRRIAERRGRRA